MSRKRKKPTARERLGITRGEWATLSPRDRYLRETYGMTEKQFCEMRDKADGGCHICGKQPKPGKVHHVDHDHKTGRVRGYLCFVCNKRVLGRGRETAEIHEAAAQYLRREYDGRLLNG